MELERYENGRALTVVGKRGGPPALRNVAVSAAAIGALAAGSIALGRAIERLVARKDEPRAVAAESPAPIVREPARAMYMTRVSVTVVEEWISAAGER